MCEANAYIVDKDGNEILFLEQVNTMTECETGMVFESIFYERKIFNGKIKELALLEHKILLEENE